MNSDQLDRQALWAISVQVLPDGSDNINGLLTALLRNVSTADVRAHQCAQASQRKNRNSWIRAGWLFLSLCVHRAVYLNPPQLLEK